MRFLFTLFCLLPLMSFGQKEIYIPIEWQQPNGLDYSFDRSAESGNFIIFWGPLAGTDPTQAPSDIAFDPEFILNTAEDLYKFYIDTIQFVDDDEGLLSQYKIILVLLHTWEGIEGWAFGGNYDGTVGAMWMHPHAASSGPTLAHEFTHTLQNYAWMLNPGHGFINHSYVGFFWEAHAEFMALQKFPSVALHFDMARWLNTCQFHWSSTRHHYQAFVFLEYIKENDGIGLINRMWNESNIGEHPLQTYMRLKGITQEELNDRFGEYAMRNVTWDYAIGDLLRERISTLEYKFVSHPTFIPEAIDTTLEWYRIPNHLAPQDYGYNIIRLYPKATAGCEKRVVHLEFQGHELVPGAEEAGWRFGLVAVDENQQPRYSPLYSDEMEILFELEDDETELYLVVSGAPQMHHNYAWEIGFPKIYRYPYDFRIENAWPEGFQPGYRDVDVSIPGAPHINGGGFVATTAFVESSAYVGPDAQVLGQAQVRGTARITDFAIIQHNALVEGNATIAGKAIIGENAHVYGSARVEDEAKVYGGCTIYGDAVIKGNSLIFFTDAYDQARLTDNTFCWGATLHGDVLLGGDAEFFRECSDGIYMQVDHAYDRHCDGLDDHPANENLTEMYIPSIHDNSHSLVCDSLVANEFNDIVMFICEGDTLEYNGQFLTEAGQYQTVYTSSSGADSIVMLFLDVQPIPEIVWLDFMCEGDTLSLYGQVFTEVGSYYVFVENSLCGMWLDVQLLPIELDTSVTVIGNTLYASDDLHALQWFDCQTGLPIPGATGTQFTPTTSGSYSLEVTSVMEACSVSSACYEILIVSTKPTEATLSWQIQPNPANNLLHVVLNSSSLSATWIEVFNMTGQRILKRTCSNNSLIESIALDGYLPGAYLIKLTDAAGSSSSRIFQKI